MNGRPPNVIDAAAPGRGKLVTLVAGKRRSAYISDLLTSVADVPGRPALRTASRGDFMVLRTNRKFGDRAFCVAAPRVWNRLPADLRQLRSTQTFRRHLKTFFIRCFLLSSDKQTFMDYVMRRRSTVGGALEMFSLPLPLPLPLFAGDGRQSVYDKKPQRRQQHRI